MSPGGGQEYCISFRKMHTIGLPRLLQMITVYRRTEQMRITGKPGTLDTVRVGKAQLLGKLRQKAIRSRSSRTA